MTDHGDVTPIAAEEGAVLVRDVRYKPRRSFEIEAVAEFAPDALPRAATPLTRRLVAAALRSA